MSGKWETSAFVGQVHRWAALCLLGASLGASLGACTFGSRDNLAYTANDAGAAQPFPTNYRAELLAFMRSYLNEPRGVREAAIAEPMQRTVGGRLRYVTCLRYNARDGDGAYPGAKERAVLYVEGRLDRIIEDGTEVCAGAPYKPFPEMEKLTR